MFERGSNENSARSMQRALRSGMPAGWVRDRAAKSGKRAMAAPFLRFSESYYFGNGSEPKFAWTNVHLLSFFTNTRVDFARAGSVFPSLSWITPT